MRPRTRSISFLREAAFGFVVSAVAAASAATLSFVAAPPVVARVVVAGIGLALVLRALAQSAERTGRIVTLAIWLAAAAAAWFFGIGIAAYVAVHAVLVWLVRALFSSSHVVAAGLDFALMVVALGFATLTAVRTDSVFLASWSLLLVLALGVAVPALAAKWTRPRELAMPDDDPNRGFALAFKSADEAFARIVARTNASKGARS